MVNVTEQARNAHEDPILSDECSTAGALSESLTSHERTFVGSLPNNGLRAIETLQLAPKGCLLYRAIVLALDLMHTIVFQPRILGPVLPFLFPGCEGFVDESLTSVGCDSWSSPDTALEIVECPASYVALHQVCSDSVS